MKPKFEIGQTIYAYNISLDYIKPRIDPIKSIILTSEKVTYKLSNGGAGFPESQLFLKFSEYEEFCYFKLKKILENIKSYT